MSRAVTGGEVRARRRALGLSPADLARAVGTRAVLVGRWEREEAVPTPEEWERLAEALDLDAGAWVGWGAPSVAPFSVSPAPPPSEAPPAEGSLRGRLSSLLARVGGLLRALRPPLGSAGVGSGEPEATGSYLNDPAEQRRYALRWAVTLLVLGALAVGLVWALAELREGFGAFLDLFRGRPPGSGLTRALPGLLPG
ncbi:MAG: helix-turn-helix transcriptional regulator [Acidimicrobiia bacterium]|nr:helix-turn-helix transcriptional regulator [Acidimicrobiia bacterium]